MRRLKIYNHLALAAILMASSCSMIKPQCQRLKFRDIFSRENKNAELVEYNEDGDCVPTLAGHQQVADLMSENPDEQYYWMRCQWVTESQRDSLIKERFDSMKF
jgi:hypothetical protein